mmetsp:Transcript_91373/g.295546  ORF Transcript_91373/g.295546 Transcript_91373/m.295546 type:complete len:249 (+) Transcript_91373:1467-2213(+)
MELALPRALRPQLAARGGFGLHRGSELRHRPVPLLLQLHALVVAGLSKICQLSFPRTLRTCCTRKLLAQLCSGCISTSLRGQLLGAEALAELRGLGRTCFCQVLQLPGPAEREALPLLRSLGPEAELLEVLAERDRLLGVLRPLHGARVRGRAQLGVGGAEQLTGLTRDTTANLEVRLDAAEFSGKLVAEAGLLVQLLPGVLELRRQPRVRLLIVSGEELLATGPAQHLHHPRRDLSCVLESSSTQRG